MNPINIYTMVALVIFITMFVTLTSPTTFQSNGKYIFLASNSSE